TIEAYGTQLAFGPENRPTTNRDIVLWDQRGTLYSKPALFCPESSQQQTDSAQSPKSAADADADSSAAYRACGQRLAKEAGDLSAFNSAENADDVEALRVALGYEAINFYGVSYGTELGQFLMRQRPEHLRSVILDAVVPLGYNLFIEPAFAQQRIGEKYLLGCAAEPTCDAAFPNLARRYLALIDRLNATPVTVQVTASDEDATRTPVELTGDVLEDTLYSALYMNVHDLIPLIIDRADRGDFTFVATYLLPLSMSDETIADGMHYSVICADGGDTSLDGVEFPGVLPRIAKNTRDEAQAELQICRDWKIELLPRQALEPVATAIPTLLLSGDFDPITPPHYAASPLPHLSRATHVIFPRGAHGQVAVSACGNAISRAFLDNPSAAPDSSCVKVAVPAFATDRDVVFMHAARNVMAVQGLSGLRFLVVFAIPAVVCAGLLLTAVPVYPIGFLVRRHTSQMASSGFARIVSRSAPWLAVVAASTLVLFLVGSWLALGSTMRTNEKLLAMAALPARWSWLFALPSLVAVLAVLMVIAAVVIWWSRQRSLAGRLYFTVLTLAAVVAAVDIVLIGR
ncbi:MAG TPA: alpha/beta fold hydrolase, partial [Vicinamibacterales bacterium]|nr:alpha/beta fold hydrolase [Vicinamibacterales bacterium]